MDGSPRKLFKLCIFLIAYYSTLYCCVEECMAVCVRPFANTMELTSSFEKSGISAKYQAMSDGSEGWSRVSKML